LLSTIFLEPIILVLCTLPNPGVLRVSFEL
jgi:hypothetical protein